MRRGSGWAPSIAPKDDDQNVYLVVDDLGRLQRVDRETDFEATDLETVIPDLLGSQYNNPVRVVALIFGVMANCPFGFRWSERPSGQNVVDLMEALRRNVGGAAA
jgi:hypothetical protein